MARITAAIVGRPNVGKSTLFNKLSGTRLSIVDDTPGVTRDRIYADVEWNGKMLTIIDTGGIEPKTDSPLLVKMRMQAEIAIETADVILFMCDVRTGLTADDSDIAVMLLKSRKPVIPVINKVDRIGDPPAEFYEFYELGFSEEPLAVSSLHGSGTGDLLDRIIELAPEKEDEETEDEYVKVAVIGKPNAGKSSLCNRIFGDERTIVSDMPGTTRDAIDMPLEKDGRKYLFIDTAGIRRQSRISDKIEKYSVLRAHDAVGRADVCLIMIDATEGVTEQDERIAGLAHEAGKASVIVVNKWDLPDKDNDTVNKYTEKVYTALSYMRYAPLIYISAKTGQRVDKLFPLIEEVNGQHKKRVTTGMLNDVLSDAQTRVQPPTDKGKRLKIYYMTQTSSAPPTFTIFCNEAKLFHFSYQRYIENCLREVFGFQGTPIRLNIRQKGDNPDNV